MSQINGVYLKGLLAVKNHKEFGKDEKIIYNYIKLLVDEDLIIVRVPDDRIDTLDKLSLYQEVECFVDIKLADANTGTSKYTANILLNNIAPVNIKKVKEGGKE